MGSHTMLEHCAKSVDQAFETFVRLHVYRRAVYDSPKVPIQVPVRDYI